MPPESGRIRPASPDGARQLTENLPTAFRGLKSGKVNPRKALLHPKLPDQKQVRRIFKEIETKDERIELNLYIVGEMAGDDADPTQPSPDQPAMAEGSQEA